MSVINLDFSLLILIFLLWSNVDYGVLSWCPNLRKRINFMSEKPETRNSTQKECWSFWDRLRISQKSKNGKWKGHLIRTFNICFSISP